MAKNRSIPQRSRRKDDSRRHYQQFLESAQVSGTYTSTTTGSDMLGTKQTGSTEYTPDDKGLSTQPYKGILPNGSRFKHYAKEIAAVFAIIGAIATVVTLYNALTNKIDNVKAELTDYKKDSGENFRKLERDIKDDLRHITERIDKYISKK